MYFFEKMRIGNKISTIYVNIIRGTPVLLQLMIIYYVIFKSVNINIVIVGILAFGLNSAAYVSEIIRSGLISVDKGQMEAGRSLGLSYGQTLQKIIVPQAIRNVLPALGNEFVVVIKESSIVSIIGIADLMYKANTVRGNTFQPFEPLLVAALVYFLLTFTLSKLLAYIEKRMRNHD